MMICRLTVLLTLASLNIATWATDSERTSRTLRLGDGESIKHLYEDGVPVLSQNEHVAIELAGYQLGSDEQGITWRWALTLRLKPNPPVVITVSDVTEKRALLLIDDSQGYFAGKRWFGQSEKFRPNSDLVPWLYESGTTQRIFRLDMRLPNGAIKVLHQPVIYTPESKQKILAMIKQGRIQ